MSEGGGDGGSAQEAQLASPSGRSRSMGVGVGVDLGVIRGRQGMRVPLTRLDLVARELLRCAAAAPGTAPS